jgi:DNA-binding transcriptional LysR family regulator
MDRLRAMEYLVRVVDAGSFAAAARELGVSPPAVTHMIAALEHELGVALLRRNSHHLSLTPDGEQFLPAAMTALAELRAAEARLSVNRTRSSGKLVVGIGRTVSATIAPFLPEFLRLHPGLALDLRVVQNPKTASVDVVVFVGWVEDADMVARRIAQTRFVTAAAPGYWESRGRPRDPEELRRHDCLAYRSHWGTVLDLWKYRRGDEVRSVALEPRFGSEDLNLILAAAVRGAGVVRVADLLAWTFLEQRLLEPALDEWEALEAPAIHVMYRRGARQSARVRAFVEFVTDVFASLEASRERSGQAKLHAVSMPPWFRSRAGGLTRRARSGPEAAARSGRV